MATPSTPSELVALNSKSLLEQVNDLLEEMRLNDKTIKKVEGINKIRAEKGEENRYKSVKYQ